MLHSDVSVVASRPSLMHLFLIFFKIGCVSWGGYMALVSVVRAEIVSKHHMIDDDEIMDGIALAMLLPGPVAVNVVAYVGNRIRGALGGAVCAIAVILPSFFLMLGFAAAYSTIGQMDIAQSALAAILPAVAAIILNAALKMRAKAVTSPIDWSLAIAALGLLLVVGGIGVVVLIIIGAACIGILRDRTQTASTNAAPPAPAAANFGFGSILTLAFLVSCLGLFLIAPQMNFDMIWAQLFSVFSGMSLLLFGGGYIFIPLVQEAVVTSQGWLSNDAFTASIALGQVTPGPILISATFIGYKVAGIGGAIAATIAIFLPPACLILLAANQLERIRHHAMYRAAQSGVHAAVFGMIVAAAFSLLRGVDLSNGLPEAAPQFAIFFIALLGLTRFKLDEVWVILMAAAVGALLL